MLTCRWRVKTGAVSLMVLLEVIVVWDCWWLLVLLLSQMVQVIILKRGLLA